MLEICSFGPQIPHTPEQHTFQCTYNLLVKLKTIHTEWVLQTIIIAMILFNVSPIQQEFLIVFPWHMLCAILVSWMELIFFVSLHFFSSLLQANRRSQWPRGLNRGSAAARLIRLIIVTIKIIIIIIIIINWNWVVTRWQWLFYMCTKHEIGYYWI